MKDYSYVFNAHPSFIENLYNDFTNDPNSVDEGWRVFFEGFQFAAQGQNGTSTDESTGGLSPKEFQVIGLINGYRRRGHFLSTTNPIRERKDRYPSLKLEDFGLTDADLGTTFMAGKEIGLKNATLQQIIDRLKKIYCGNIGLEYFYISKKATRRWLRERLETFNDDSYGFNLDKKKRILEKLNGAEGFEHFLHKKYVGQKRFSLEGGETTIPALDAIINKFSELGGEEVVMGMAHRGRLNVLANIMGKTYEHIFNEFEGTAVPDLSFGDGDVKYHLGYSSQVETPAGKKVNLKLSPNPSHLEAVNPVVLGFTRAKSDMLYTKNFDQIMPILIHGDAAIAGQGIVYETAQMSELEGYKTGGTIHFVINNQIGFTTDFDEARSSNYSTSVAAVTEAPVIHVNGDDPEAVVFAAELAVEYRQKFHTDIYIDMVCYRKHGHNEGDDPSFTQPKMYKIIKNHRTSRSIYIDQLVSRGEIEAKLAKDMDDTFNVQLQERFDKVKQASLPYEYQEPEMAWKAMKKITTAEDFDLSPPTGVSKKNLDIIIQQLLTIPSDIKPHTKMNRLIKGFKTKIKNNEYDWAFGELMAYGSILMEGKDVRMTGQDVRRGTFSHRHAVLIDTETSKRFNRLSNLSEDQGKYRIYNSLLSEFGVLGFEFGYSMAAPNSLVVWEAQFGDFYNGAQVMIDQFITSSESKWRRMSGLVMLLPHGYAGQGPEHSSARLERFLQSCAEFNMTVANVTSPANFFHLIRRQLARPFRKPLVVMSPKSMLRHPLCISPIEAFTDGNFQEVLDDPITSKTKASAKKVKRILLCTGKIYYDLLNHQNENNRTDVAIIRFEQLYPFPKKQANTILDKYGDKVEFYWVQEEPSNMGAWQFMLSFTKKFDMKLVSRKSSASPATGFKKVHDAQQQAIIEEAFAK